MKIRIEPYGYFEIIKKDKKGIQNCKECWFGQTNNGIHHCPNHIRCSFKDGTGIIFLLDKSKKI